MRNTKKLVGLLLALVMVFAMSTVAFAAGNGSITIKNPVEGQTYKAYLMFELESFNATTGAYAYKITENWREFVTTGAGKDYFSIDEKQDYVTLKEGVTVADNSEVAATIAKAAVAYATSKGLTPAATLPNDGSYTANGLTLGYYVVDTTLGTLCSLDTTNSSVDMLEKNAAPENKKTVEEDSTGNYGEKNDADIGQTVNFKCTITAQAGAQNYVFHDTMSAGLTYTGVTGITLNGTAVDASNYTVVTTGLTDGCTFEVRFTQAFCDTLAANNKIVISYTATLNEMAKVGLEGNPNESKLSYGVKDSTTGEPSGTTPPSETKTYTWDLDVLKYANGDESKVLKDAQFALLNKAKDKVATIVGGKVTGWADVPTAGQDGTITWPDNTVLTTGENGKIEIDGLDADTYYLREVKAPAGYNKLASDVEIVVTGATTVDGKLTYTTVVAKVNNQSGTELPSTGGIGTTIFYVIGGVLVIGAAALLIAKRKKA